MTKLSNATLIILCAIGALCAIDMIATSAGFMSVFDKF